MESVEMRLLTGLPQSDTSKSLLLLLIICDGFDFDVPWDEGQFLPAFWTFTVA
jgi:hypothetical protein